MPGDIPAEMCAVRMPLKAYIDGCQRRGRKQQNVLNRFVLAAKLFAQSASEVEKAASDPVYDCPPGEERQPVDV